MVDQTANFVRGEADSSIAAGDTTISVVNASEFPDPANGQYNVVLWDDSLGRPDQDDDAEIVRVTGRDTTNDNLTVTRAQEGTSDVSHPSGSALQLSPTAKTIDDIDTEKAGTNHDNNQHSETYTTTGENVENFSTSGSADTVPTSQGNGTLQMETVSTGVESTRMELASNTSTGTVFDLQTAFDELGYADPTNNQISIGDAGTYLIVGAGRIEDPDSSSDKLTLEVILNGSIETMTTFDASTGGFVDFTVDTTKVSQLSAGDSLQIKMRNFNGTDNGSQLGRDNYLSITKLL